MKVSGFFRSRQSALRLLGFFVAAIVATAMASPVHAQTTATWTGGGGSGNWSNASNWTVIPTTSGSWALVFGGTTQTTGTNTIGTITLNSLSFTNDGTAGNTGLFTLSGSTLALTSGTISTTAVAAGGTLAATGDSISNALTLTGANTVTLGAGHNLTLGGNISGTGSIAYGGTVSNGSTPLYVSGSNSYSGDTFVTGIRVQNAFGNSVSGTANSNDFAFGTGKVFVSGSGSVVIRNSSNVANNFSIAGVGTTMSGSPQGAIRGSFGTSGQTAVMSGSLSLSADATIRTASGAGLTGNSLRFTNTVDLGANVLTLSPGASSGIVTPIEITGGIVGSGSIVVDGTASRVVLSGNNSYAGGTTLTSGTLQVGSSTALGTGLVTVNGASLDLNGQALLVGGLSGTTSGVITSSVAGPASLTTTQSNLTTYQGTITDGAGKVSLAMNGSGNLWLSGSNSYSGGTTITAGRVQNAMGNSTQNQGDFNDYAFGTGDVVVSGSGTVVIRNRSTVANNMTISGSGGMSAGSNAGAIRGSFGVSNQTATLSGTVSLSGNALITTAASTSGLSGNKLVMAGPVELGANTLTFAPGLSGSEPLPIEVTGAIRGTGSVVVSGSSAVYLNALNTYTGLTSVNAGTLGGNGTVAGTVAVNNGGTLSPGASADTYGTLSVGALDLNSGAVAALGISGTASGTYDQVVSSGLVDFAGSLSIDFATGGFATGDHWQLFSGSSFTGHFDSVATTGVYSGVSWSYLGSGRWQGTGGALGAGQSLLFFEDNSNAVDGMFTAGQLAVVPEPATSLLAGVGIFVVACGGWRRRRARIALV
jgi:autotransporter-associated beta strand protein